MMTGKNTYKPLNAEQVQQLQSQGCTAHDWKKIFVTNDFDAHRVKDTCFIGQVKIGATCGSIKDVTGLEKACGIYDATIADSAIGDNCRISRIGVHIANYDIESNICIENVGTMHINAGAAFGNGVEVNVLNEAGGREVVLFNELNAQFAYIMCLHRYRPRLIEKLKAMVSNYVASVKSDRGRIGMGAKICSVSKIIDVNIGEFAEINGASCLVNGTILSSLEAPVMVGSQVIAEDFIIAEGSSVKDGAILEKVYIGQGCRIARQFSAENSLFFANSEGMHGEACSVFAGPYTVTHHKSTLLIAGLFSFYNAGSGTNQSNHMYKLGPAHEGKLERGSKTGSFSYMMWPCRVGPFTTVLGKHTTTFDTSNFPFSHLGVGPDGRSMIVPGLYLTTVGTVRDGAKWPNRDRRKGYKRDIISFDVFSPYTIGKMMTAIDRLAGLQETTDKSVEEVPLNGVVIQRPLLRTAQKYYRNGVEMYLLEKVVSKVEQSLNAGIKKIIDMFRNDSDAVYSFCWVDIGGQLMPQQRLFELEESVENGNVKTAADFSKCITDIHNAYCRDEWLWVKKSYKQFFDTDLDNPTRDTIVGAAQNLLKTKGKFLTLVLADAQREFSELSRCGFGVDAGPEEALKDFAEVRGNYETNKFVMQINGEIKLLENRIEKLTRQLADVQ